MVVPTGTASAWQEADAYGQVWVCPLDKIGSGADLLAEAIRLSGHVWSLGVALRAAESAELERGFFGYVDESDDITLCDQYGATDAGEYVDTAFECVIARFSVLLSDM